MAVPTPLVVLFYVWLVVSLGILAYRVATRNSRRSAVTRASDTDRALRTDWAPPPSASPTEHPRPIPAQPPTPPAGPPSSKAPGRPVGPGERPPLDPPLVPPLAPPRPSPPPVHRSDLPPATTLIEALAGIAMPCDLLPLTSVEGRVLGERELLLATSGHPAEDVGEAFASALEALGYEITPMGPVTVLATRGPDRVTVVLHERPYDELSGKRSAFPTTKPGDVVLELRL